MIWLRLHFCVFPASLSNAHHWSERKGLDRALSFRSHDSVHSVLLGQILHLRARRRRQCIHPQSWYWPIVLVNWQLVLAGEVALVQWAECFKKFQAHFEVLHRIRLNPWACASWPFGKSLDFFTSAIVFFAFCFCGLCSFRPSFLCGDLERSLATLWFNGC